MQRGPPPKRHQKFSISELNDEELDDILPVHFPRPEEDDSLLLEPLIVETNLIGQDSFEFDKENCPPSPDSTSNNILVHSNNKASCGKQKRGRKDELSIFGL